MDSFDFINSYRIDEPSFYLSTPSSTLLLDKIYGNAPDDLLYGTAVSGELTDTTWWDTDYSCRRKVVIYPTISGVITSGTITLLDFDPSVMPEALESFNDVRIVRFINDTWTDLPRDYLYESANEYGIETNRLAFRTQDTISGVADEGYYLYWGNANAGIPTSGIVTTLWDFQDDFDTGTFLDPGTIWDYSEGVGFISENNDYLEIQSIGTGWDKAVIAYVPMPEGSIVVIQTEIIYEYYRYEYGGIILTDGTRDNAFMFGLCDSASNLYFYHAVAVDGVFSETEIHSGGNVGFHWKLEVRNTRDVYCYYSTDDAATWILKYAVEIDFTPRWAGLFEHNGNPSYADEYMRYEYFYYYNKAEACCITEKECPFEGRRLRGGKYFTRSGLQPFNSY